MASLIPAEVMAQMLARRGQVQTVPTGMGQVQPRATPMAMPSGMMDNPSMQLQNAHAQAVAKGRGQTSTPASGPGNRGPVSSSLYKSMLIDAAGVDDKEREKYNQLAHDDGTTPQMLHQLLQTRQQNRPPAQHDFAGQAQQPANQMTFKTPDQTAPETGSFKLPQEYQGMAQHSLFAKQAQSRTAQVPGAQQNDPVVQMINSFQGQIPEQLRQAGIAAIQSGAKPEQVLGHFQNAMQNQQHMQATQQHQQMQQSQHQRDQLMKANPGIDYEGDESQFVGNDPETLRMKHVFQQVKGAGGEQAQLPQPPKPGHQLDAQSAQHFMQAAGGDKNKARLLAQQTGWSF
jgi:hypothetical protein